MRKAIVLLMAAAMLSIAVPALGTDSDARPFKGSMNGSVLFEPDPACDNNPWLIRTDSQATGEVSHLGSTVMTSAHCTPAVETIEGGEMTLVAANGDRVFIEYEGTAPPPNQDGIIIADVDFVIVGGDGRFTGATGGGDMTAFIVFEGLADPEWPASWVWSGTIGY
jgi:hypothetical protein